MFRCYNTRIFSCNFCFFKLTTPQSVHVPLANTEVPLGSGISKWPLEFTAKQMRPPLPSWRGRIHAPRRESSQCPAQLATTQQSPLAPWPWLWVCLHSHGTAQNRLLLIAQDREPGEEGGVVVEGDGRWWGGEKLAFNERTKSTWTMKHGSPPTYMHVHWCRAAGHLFTHTYICSFSVSR